jgi:hypothetical protein
MGRRWTQDDVLAYNIKVVYQDLQTFFGVTDLPPPNTESRIFTARDFATAVEPGTSHMLRHMDRITRAADGDNKRSSTIDLVRELFEVIHYPNLAQKREMTMYHTLRYLRSCGRPPQLDIGIMHDFTTISLVVKVNKHSPWFEPEPRLISDVIAAFQNDNIVRVKRLGIDPLISKVMPGIVMDGSMPTFYKIPVTHELVRAVESGKRPEDETVVYAYRPRVPKPEEGMRPLDNRQIILSCFEAFRQLL